MKELDLHSAGNYAHIYKLTVHLHLKVSLCGQEEQQRTGKHWNHAE